MRHIKEILPFPFVNKDDNTRYWCSVKIIFGQIAMFSVVIHLLFFKYSKFHITDYFTFTDFLFGSLLLISMRQSLLGCINHLTVSREHVKICMIGIFLEGKCTVLNHDNPNTFFTNKSLAIKCYLIVLNREKFYRPMMLISSQFPMAFQSGF